MKCHFSVYFPGLKADCDQLPARLDNGWSRLFARWCKSVLHIPSTCTCCFAIITLSENVQGVTVVKDGDQYSTDLMKCMAALVEKEKSEGKGVSESQTSLISSFNCIDQQQYDVILLGGLSGRLDQTIHTLSYLHKLRKTRKRVFVVDIENVGWVLDEVWIFTFRS